MIDLNNLEIGQPVIFRDFGKILRRAKVIKLTNTQITTETANKAINKFNRKGEVLGSKHSPVYLTTYTEDEAQEQVNNKNHSRISD